MTQDLQMLTNQEITTFFSSIAKQEYKKLRTEVKKAESKITKAIKFTQEKYYRIDEEQYKITPKIYSIKLDSLNKQRVTLEFKNNPNLSFIKNILTLHSAKYNIDILPGSKITLVTLEENALEALAHLMNIYQKISTEAGSLIWESLLPIVEDAMDKTASSESVTWKEALNYNIVDWASSIFNEEGELTIAPSQYWGEGWFSEYSEYLAKLEYTNRDDNERENFLEAIIRETVKIKTQEILTFMEQDIDPYRTIQLAFNSVEKCNQYIANNLPNGEVFIKHASDVLNLDLDEKFEPSIVETILSAEGAKRSTKFTGGAVKSTISLIGGAVKEHWLAKILLTAADVSNVVLSAMHFTNVMTAPIKIPNMEEIKEISSQFICMNLICNSKMLLELTEESHIKLIKFYGSFIQKTIKGSFYGNEDISDYLLDQISNTSYIESIGLKSEISTLLINKNGEEFTISSFVSAQNKTTCYDSLLNTLNGGIVPQVLTIVESEHHNNDSEAYNAVECAGQVAQDGALDIINSY